MVRPRIDRYETIEAFLMINIGFQASPTQLRERLNIDCTKVAMNHYILNLKKDKRIFEVNGRYYLPHQICDHCKEKEATDMVCMSDHENCEYLCDDCYVDNCIEVGI